MKKSSYARAKPHRGRHARGDAKQEMSSALAARILRYAAECNLQPGTHLGAQHLADHFQVSRTPVNRALEQLSRRGFLEHRERSGYYLRASAMKEALIAEEGTEDLIEQLYLRIADDYLKGRLPALVSETSLLQRYNVTRGLLKSVLQRVSNEGWGEPRAGYGWRFLEILRTPRALLQTFEFRLVLEPAALLSPGYRLDPEAAERSRALEERLLAGALETDPPDVIYERSVRFHEAIAAGSPNPFFLDAIKRINRVRRLLTYRSMVLDRKRYYDRCREHLEILDLVLRGRNKLAASAMTKHLEVSRDSVERMKSLLEV